jgi:hypothetical protein
LFRSSPRSRVIDDGGTVAENGHEGIGRRRPDSILYAGRGGTVCFEANGEENAFLGYRRNDIRRAVQEIVAYCRPIVAGQQIG